jgi:transcription antitermination factor NusG
MVQPTDPLVERWYALAVRGRQEKAAEGILGSRGFHVFLPTRAERRAWSDRVQTLRRALFPGYLFLRTALTAARRVEILKVPQAFDLVGRIPGDDRIARHVPDVEVESIRILVEADREVDPVDRLVLGTPVQVVGGGLKGAWGVVEDPPDGKRRLVVQVHLLGRGVRAHLCADDVLEAKGPAA